jgi:hypothetical protein
MAETFGITPQIIMDLFQKTLPASVAPKIQRWINQAAGRLGIMLRDQNIEASAIVALGVDDPAYLVCQTFLEVKAGMRAHQSFARHETELAQAFREEAKELDEFFRNSAENLLEGMASDELRGTFRGASGATAAVAGGSLAGKARSWAGRIQISQAARRLYSGTCARNYPRVIG